MNKLLQVLNTSSFGNREGTQLFSFIEGLEVQRYNFV